MIRSSRLSCALLLFASLAKKAFAANASETFDRVVGNGTAIEYIRLNYNFPHLPQVPEWMCKTKVTKYRGSIAESLAKGYPDVYRVPHSRIFEDGIRCGERNDSYPLLDQYIDRHMRLFPYHLVLKRETAIQAGLEQIFNALHDIAWHARHIADQLLGEVVESDLWLGYEIEARECGGKEILPAGTFILFGRSRASQGIRLTVPDLLNPNTKKMVPETEYLYSADEDLHVSFVEPFAGPGSDPATILDLVCPSQNIQFEPPAETIKNEPPSDKENSKNQLGSCFPADATVELIGGARVTMSRLSIGDKVRVGFDSYSEVFMFTHRVESLVHEFIVLESATGASLALTKGHFLHADGSLVPASNVKIGSRITLADGSTDRVVSISTKVSHGLYNPQTVSGEIIVNNVLVSTYTTAVEPSIAHAALIILRPLYSIFGFSITSFESGSGLAYLFLKAFRCLRFET